MPDRRTLHPAGAGGALTATLAVALVVPAAPAQAMPAADHEMPFPCGQEWHGSTRSGHSPSWYSIDWNRTDDLGAPMLASAAGVVTRVENLGDRSYGLYLILDHRNGESSLYAHLQAEYVTVGQRVDQGELIGRLGTSGGSTGPHLHYEQREDGRGVQPYFHDRAFQFNTTLASRSCVDTPVAGDWDGDGRDQVGVFRRGSRGVFRLDAGQRARTARWGSPLDQPVVGDWDGDRQPDLGARNPLTSTFRLQGEGGSLQRVRFGRTTDRAVAGDWNGNRVTDVGVWRPGRAKFLLRAADGSVRRQRVGSVGSLPVTGDWDGNGTTDLGAFSAGTWSLRLTRTDGSTYRGTFSHGRAGDLPVVGDWNGDGADELGIWRPRRGMFSLRKAPPLAQQATTVVKQRFGRRR